jgi:hypothetical protein
MVYYVHATMVRFGVFSFTMFSDDRVSHYLLVLILLSKQGRVVDEGRNR